MPQSTTLLYWIDPRGRCNRKGLAKIALVVLAVQAVLAIGVWQVGIDLRSSGLMLLNLGFVWLATTAVIKRLHDLGLSGWWIIGALFGFLVWSMGLSLVAMTAWGAEALLPGSAHFTVCVALNIALVIAVTLWLHLAKGDAGDNAYGPVPGTEGFSGPDRAGERRPLPAGSPA